MKKILQTPDYNMCNISRIVKGKENSVIQNVLQQLVKSVNIPVSCPFRKGRIIFKNFFFDGSRLSSMIPSGLYLSNANLLTMEQGVKILIFRVASGLKVETL